MADTAYTIEHAVHDIRIAACEMEEKARNLRGLLLNFYGLLDCTESGMMKDELCEATIRGNLICLEDVEMRSKNLE